MQEDWFKLALVYNLEVKFISMDLDRGVYILYY